MSRTLRRLAAVALPTTLMLAGIAVPAFAASGAGALAPAFASRSVAHWATFQGEVDRGGMSGVAGDNVGTPTVEDGTCTDTGSGLTDTSCSVSWVLENRSICTIKPGELVEGFGSYTSSTNESIFMPLTGAGEVGSGVLEGRVTILGTDGRPTVAHMVIDAGDYCGAALLAESITGSQLELASQTRGGTFSGHVDLLAA